MQIVKAEDARRFEKTLEDLLKDSRPDVRTRAALAVGRIGDERAIPFLSPLLEKGTVKECETAAFAIGEIESAKGADSILKAIENSGSEGLASIRARLLEAAGKIAAANPKDERSKALGAAIVKALEGELAQGRTPSPQTIRLGLTAVLRARPTGAEGTVRKFLAFTDPNIVADALNTLTRLRAKNANRDARDLLATHPNAVIRANAARVLGAAEDKEAVDVLIKAATEDVDSRVRVSAMRGLASIKDPRAVDKLLERGEKLFANYKSSKYANPTEKNELVEIVAAVGRLATGTNDDRTLKLIRSFREADKGHSPEIEIAFARVAPSAYVSSFVNTEDWLRLSAQYQGLMEIAGFDEKTAVDARLKARLILIQEIALRFNSAAVHNQTVKSRPDLVRAFAVFKSDNTSNILRPLLENEKDVFVRAAIAEVLGDQPSSRENVEELKTAFSRSLTTDKIYDDAQLAILDALAKLDKKGSVDTLTSALSAPDYLVRKKAFEILSDADLQRETPSVARALENARSKHIDQVLPYSSATGTKLGQLLNTDADYRRALSRKNGKVKAVVTTEKGTFTIDLLPEDAPLTVDNFVKLARANYFNGLMVHRVVPNFVMQDGDPRGDGNGGPGWSIRCEINMVPYGRGAIGMALSGKDTGGSQWFATHSPQPHLDGGYTVFGKVNELGMKVVDNIVRGDKIVSIRIVETAGRTRGRK
jgi:cyclophilin family peptidyl-prolyl cis-trans isomerase/HEAT repeat protein